MDQKTSTTLDPKLRETYDRIMGNPASPMQNGDQNKDEQVSHIPKPLEDPRIAPIQPKTQLLPPRHISALQTPGPHSSIGGAIGVHEVMEIKKSHNLTSKLIYFVVIFAILGALVYLVKLYDLPLPDLNKLKEQLF